MSESDNNATGVSWDAVEGGLFGKWVPDERGLPSYEYAFLEGADPDRSIKEDHWHQVGNDRHTAEAHAGGWIVPHRYEHGLTRLCSNDPHQIDKLGSVGILKVGSAPGVELLHHRLPAGAPWKVVWGEGYAEYKTVVNGVSVVKRITAPFGDDPVIVVDVTITGDADVEYEERWGIEPYPITIPAPMTKTGPAPKSKILLGDKALWHLITGASHGLRKVAEAYRGAYSKYLDWKIETTESAVIASSSVRHILPLPAPNKRTWRDMHPQPLFIAARGDGVKLDSSQREWGVTLSAKIVGKASSASPLKFRIVFGWAESKDISPLIEKHIGIEPAGWSGHAPNVTATGESWISREMNWHGYYLRSMIAKDDYFGSHFLPQGSAYGFLHGMHGAPRDYALSVMPMIYLAPNLAREMILQMLMLMKPNGETVYSHGGFGQTSSAGGMHAAPTDLPNFLLWSIVEYLGATGDENFLDRGVDFYPREKGRSSSVRERIELLWNYLRYQVGKGPHGMLRVGTGDWNDPISLMVPSARAFHRNGESSFNTAFAVYILPKAADVIETWNRGMAQEMREYSAGLAKALDEAWTGEWYYRGWDGLGGPVGKDRLFLDANVWCLISGVGGPDRMRTLAAKIGELLDDPSPIGANILDKPVRVAFGALAPGWDCNGGVWAALNGLLAWGYSLCDPDRAWQNLYKQSLAAHSTAYPHIWFGIWSGPDAYNAHYAERPGETFVHPVTPMQEYPIMNSNAHALPLLGLLKLAGVEPRGFRLVVDPKIPASVESWSVDTPLLRIESIDGNIKAAYNKIDGFSPREPIVENAR